MTPRTGLKMLLSGLKDKRQDIPQTPPPKIEDDLGAEVTMVATLVYDKGGRYIGYKEPDGTVSLFDPNDLVSQDDDQLTLVTSSPLPGLRVPPPAERPKLPPPLPEEQAWWEGCAVIMTGVAATSLMVGLGFVQLLAWFMGGRL